MANDTNKGNHQIFGTTVPSSGQKRLIKWVRSKKIKSSTTTNTTKETMYRTTTTFETVLDHSLRKGVGNTTDRSKDWSFFCYYPCNLF